MAFSELLTRQEAIALLDRCERDGVRVLNIEGFRRQAAEAAVPVEDTYAEFSDTFGGGYSDADVIHDARMYLEVMPPDLLFKVETAPGQ